jgi:hypothetical protein
MKTELKESIQILDDLSKLLDDRVEDLYQVKGGMQARHAYMFYREKVWEVIDKLKSVKQQEQ